MSYNQNLSLCTEGTKGNKNNQKTSLTLRNNENNNDKDYNTVQNQLKDVMKEYMFKIKNSSENNLPLQIKFVWRQGDNQFSTQKEVKINEEWIIFKEPQMLESPQLYVNGQNFFGLFPPPVNFSQYWNIIVFSQYTFNIQLDPNSQMISYDFNPQNSMCIFPTSNGIDLKALDAQGEEKFGKEYCEFYYNKFGYHFYNALFSYRSDYRIGRYAWVTCNMCKNKIE